MVFHTLGESMGIFDVTLEKDPEKRLVQLKKAYDTYKLGYKLFIITMVLLLAIIVIGTWGDSLSLWREYAPIALISIVVTTMNIPIRYFFELEIERLEKK